MTGYGPEHQFSVALDSLKSTLKFLILLEDDEASFLKTERDDTKL